MEFRACKEEVYDLLHLQLINRQNLVRRHGRPHRRQAAAIQLPRRPMSAGAPGELNQSAIGLNVANANQGIIAQGFPFFRKPTAPGA